MKNNSIKKIISLLFEVGTLRKITRGHRQFLLTDDLTDNIATHSFRTAIIGHLMALVEKADADKVMKIALFHDLEEARSGDQNWLNKKYVKVFDDEITSHQLNEFSEGKKIKGLLEEYLERQTKESKLAKDADILDEILLLREYELQGNQEAPKWILEQEKGLSTKTAKQFAEEIKTQNPHDWWWNNWTRHRR